MTQLFRTACAVAWSAGTVLVLLVFSPTGVGYAFVIAQAAVVGFLAELEYAGLRRIAA